MSEKDLAGKDGLVPWMVRLNAECDELYGRIQRLLAFTESEKLTSVDTSQCILLGVQLQAMITYHCILVTRLALVGIRKEVIK